MTRESKMLLVLLPSILFVSAQELRNPAAAQAPSAGQTASSGSLRQLIPGHYVYYTTNRGQGLQQRRHRHERRGIGR